MTFDFDPTQIFRVYNHKKEHQLSIVFVMGGELYIPYNPKEYDQVIQDLKDHCQTRKIGVNVEEI